MEHFLRLTESTKTHVPALLCPLVWVVCILLSGVAALSLVLALTGPVTEPGL